MDDMVQNTNELRPADYNPRVMSKQQADALRRSIDELGDLSGIIKNIQTGNLVGGHMRLEQFTKMGGAQIVYTWRATETPGPSGSTAMGYIIHPKTGERFAYREVTWPIDATDPETNQSYSSKEMLANIAANRISGDWNIDALTEINYQLSQLPNADDLLALTGQTDKEIEKLLANAGVGDLEQPDEIGESPKDSDKLEFRITVEQREVIEEALENIKATHEMAAEENGSRNGSALYYMARDYLDRLHGMTDETETIATDPNLLVG